MLCWKWEADKRGIIWGYYTIARIYSDICRSSLGQIQCIGILWAADPYWPGTMWFQ